MVQFLLSSPYFFVHRITPYRQKCCELKLKKIVEKVIFVDIKNVWYISRAFNGKCNVKYLSHQKVIHFYSKILLFLFRPSKNFICTIRKPCAVPYLHLFPEQYASIHLSPDVQQTRIRWTRIRHRSTFHQKFFADSVIFKYEALLISAIICLK